MSEAVDLHGRAPPGFVEAQARKIHSWAEIRRLLDAVPSVLLVVNSTRQIIYANLAATVFFGVPTAGELWGKRLGEAAKCLHGCEAPDGCGTAEACRVCGAFLAIARGLRGKSSIEECQMMRDGGFPLDLNIWARPFEIGDERFIFLTIKDTSSEKRCMVLEKIFFHDLLNTVGGLKSIGEMVENSTPDELRELRDVIASLSEQLVDEIQAQKDLLAAERGELRVRMQRANSRDVVSKTIALYLKNPACDGKDIQASEVCEEILFFSDMAILLRVLGNLAKNALEATLPAGTVVVGCHSPTDDTVEFFVHNQAFIPREVQLRIFNRSFSTKGSGRGIGTYSVKLLTERFLTGKVDFSSTPSEGTVFCVNLPKEPLTGIKASGANCAEILPSGVDPAPDETPPDRTG